MTSGVYTALDLTSTFERMPEVALVLRPIIDLVAPDPEQGPYVAAIGPLTISSDHTLVRRSDQPIWDVNGYYRALGVSWPYRVTKRELLQRYLVLNGQDNEWITYAFKRLIDEPYRDFYDRRDLGDPVDDLYRWLLMKRRAAQWASIETLRTGKTHSSGDFIPSDLRERMEGQDQEEESPPQEPSFAPSTNVLWPYGYYLWNTRFRDDLILTAWQSILIGSFWRQGLSVSFAVGYFDRTSSAAAVRYRLSYPDVEAILLRSGQLPTPELADAVVGTYQTVRAVDIAHPMYVEHPCADPQ